MDFLAYPGYDDKGRHKILRVPVYVPGPDSDTGWMSPLVCAPSIGVSAAAGSLLTGLGILTGPVIRVFTSLMLQGVTGQADVEATLDGVLWAPQTITLENLTITGAGRATRVQAGFVYRLVGRFYGIRLRQFGSTAAKVIVLGGDT